MYHLFAYLAEAGIFGQVRDIPVHLTIHLDVLDYVTAVGLQPAVEVMQVVYARNRAGGGVEQLGRDSFRQRVVAFLLPARYQVVSVLGDHAVQFRNFVGTVLEVGIHGDDHITFSPFKTAEECR